MPNIGIVLSGGFAKGAYQVGVLNAIREVIEDEHIKYISASSIGVLNAYAYVQNKMDVIEKMWRSVKFSGIRPFVNAYVRSPYIRDGIDEISSGFSPDGPGLYATFLNLTKLRLNYINLKDVDPAYVKDFLQASITLPMFSRPIEISGRKYVDGALVDNIPVGPIMKHPLDYAIVVHFDKNNYTFENDYFDSKLIKINFLDDRVIKDSLAFDKDSISYMIKSGYEESMTLFDMILKNGPGDLEYIYQKIRFINDIRGKKSFRLTGDIVVNNMNKVLKKIIRSKI